MTLDAIIAVTIVALLITLLIRVVISRDPGRTIAGEFIRLFYWAGSLVTALALGMDAGLATFRSHIWRDVPRPANEAQRRKRAETAKEPALEPDGVRVQ